MNDLQKLTEKIEANATAIESVTHAMNVDRKMSHNKHTNGHFTKALSELNSLQTSLVALKIRMEAVGK